MKTIYSNPLVSIVINYRNERENVDMAPKCLCDQTYRNFEVILVDDASDDDTTDLILRKYGHCLSNVRVYKMHQVSGLRKARNFGVRQSIGDIIVTLDLHVLFDKEFIRRIVQVFVYDKKVGAVASLVLPLGKRWFHKGIELIEKIASKLRSKSSNYGFVVGSAAAYRREALLSIGFLREDEVVEDVDASWKLVSKGWKIVYLEDNIVYHKEPDTLKDWVKKVFKGGLRLFFLLKEHKTKLLAPLVMIRVTALPLLIFAICVYTLTNMPFHILTTFIIFVSLLALNIFYLFSKNLVSSIYATVTLAMMLLIQSFSFYYGFIILLLRKLGLIKEVNVDVKG